MTVINVKINGKTAICQKRYLISANSTYCVKFSFDEEWDGSAVKTARIIFDSQYIDKIFTGDTVELPKIPVCQTLAIGVFTDTLATNAAQLGCIPSVADFDGDAVFEFTQSQYDQIVALLNQVDLRQIESIERVGNEVVVSFNNESTERFPLYDGKCATFEVGNVTTVGNGEAARIENVGTETEAVLDFYLPKGDTGATGATPQLSIGTVQTISPDESATATLTGTAENPVLNLGLPQGESGTTTEEIANGIENFSFDTTENDPETSKLAYQLAFAVRGYRDISKYITNERFDAFLDNLVLASDAQLPEKIYIKYTGAKTLNAGSGFNDRTEIKEVAFERDISFNQGLPSFANCTNLEKITLPENISALGSFAYTALKSIESDSATTTGSFAYCTQLEFVRLPNVTDFKASSAFQYCEKLQYVSFPKLVNLGVQAFWYSGLKKADFAVLSSISNHCFWNTPLETLILRSETVCTMSNINALGGTSIAKGTGYIYVPSVLVEEYKAATNWVTYAEQIRAIEDYPEITGGTV